MWNIGSHDVQIEHSPVCSYKKQDQLFIIFINACCVSSLQRQVVWSENNKQRQFYNDFDRFFTWTVWGQTYMTSSWAFLFWFFSYFNAICDPFLNMNEENGIYWSLGKDSHFSYKFYLLFLDKIWTANLCRLGALKARRSCKSEHETFTCKLVLQ